MTTDVQMLNTETGPMLRIEEQPNGPLITINQDGTVLIRRAPPDEAGRLFWDAVNIHGMTLKKRIDELADANTVLQQQNQVLLLDPFKSVVHGSAEAVWQEIPKAARTKLVRADVAAVLDAVNRLACKAIQ